MLCVCLRDVRSCHEYTLARPAVLCSPSPTLASHLTLQKRQREHSSMQSVTANESQNNDFTMGSTGPNIPRQTPANIPGAPTPPPPNTGNGNGNGNVQNNFQQMATTQEPARPAAVELTRSEEIQVLPTMGQVSGLVPVRSISAMAFACAPTSFSPYFLPCPTPFSLPSLFILLIPVPPSITLFPFLRRG